MAGLSVQPQISPGGQRGSPPVSEQNLRHCVPWPVTKHAGPAAHWLLSVQGLPCVPGPDRA